MDLEFDVCKQIITRTDNEKVVNLSDNYLRLCFTFKGTDWSNLSKFVLVHHKRGTTRLELDNEDGVTLPDGLLLSDKLDFTVYGVDDPDDESVRITTNKQRVYLLDSSYTDEYSEIAEVISVHTIEDIYETLDNKADTTALDGKVDKVTGKGLSSNDYTDSDKNIVSHIEDDLEEALQQLESTIIDSINARVKYTDVKDNLTSVDTDKPLSAKQGKELKTLVDTKANTSDMTTALGGKSDVGHTHTKSDVTDFTHTHVKEDITDFAHNHDDRYYTESEMDTLLSAKVNTTDIKDNLTSTDTDKPLSANQGKELKDLVDTKAGEEDMYEQLDYKSNKGHTHVKANITDFAHTHDDRYYTESEIDDKLLLPFPSIYLRSGDIYQFTPSVSKNYVAGGKIFLCMVDPNTTWASGKTVFNVYFYNDEDYVTMYGYNLLYNDSSVTKSFEKGTIYLCYSVDTSRVIFFPLSEMPVDNLTTNNAYVSLSAKQGKVLKELVDGKASSSHTHTKSDITDFTHTHTKSDVTDFAHNHDDRYYTETEVNAIRDGLLNRCSLNSDKDIIQTGDTANLTVYVCENGVPVANREVKFYKVTED